MHVPLVQDTELAFAALHTCPQAPQFLGSVLRFTSHPSDATPLQLANPALHGPTWQVPLTQVAVAFGNEQTWPHAPQLFGSIEVETQMQHWVVPFAHFAGPAAPAISGSASTAPPATMTAPSCRKACRRESPPASTRDTPSKRLLRIGLRPSWRPRPRWCERTETASGCQGMSLLTTRSQTPD